MSRIEGSTYEPDFTNELLTSFKPANQVASSAPEAQASARPTALQTRDVATLTSGGTESACAARPETTKALSDAYARLAFQEARLEIAREAVSLPTAQNGLAKKYGEAFAKALPERIRADQTAVKSEMKQIAVKLREMSVDPKKVTGPLGIPVRAAVTFIKQQETVKSEGKSDRCDIARKTAKDFQELSKVAKKAGAVVGFTPIATAAKTLSTVSRGAAFVINAVCWGLDKGFVNNVDSMLKALGHTP